MDKAMWHVRYGRIADGAYFGVMTEDACHQELRDVLGGWILLHIADHTPLPVVDGFTREVDRPA